MRLGYVIDENDDCRKICAEYLRALGFITVCFSSIDKAKSYGHSETPQLVLADEEKNGINLGIAYFKSLKSNERSQQVLTILTSDRFDQDVRLGLKEGHINKYLPKPFGLESLRQTLLSLGLS